MWTCVVGFIMCRYLKYLCKEVKMLLLFTGYRYNIRPSYLNMSGPGPRRDRDIGRKWESGSAKRKRKAERAVSNQVLSSGMMKFLKKTASGSTESSESIASTSKKDIATSETPLNLGSTPDALSTEPQSEIEIGSNSSQSESETETPVLSSRIHEEQIGSPPVSSDASDVVKQAFVSSDPGMWTFPITDSQRHDIVQSGPTQQLNNSDEDYPKDDDHRHFSNFHFSRKLINGETQHRRWLVYSNSQNKIFCFPCRLFGNSQTQMVQGGCCDWKHLSSILQRHENTKEHMAFMFQWMTLEKGIKHGKTIDQENERLIRESQKHWHNLFERLIDIINFLASHNLAFRGHRESLKIGDDSGNSGNFIDLFKLISKYDPTLREHMKRINDKQLAHHYLSHDIQNELITLMSKTITDEVIRRVKEAKYYSILLDCTIDYSRVEQMSVILRFCNTSTGTIEENFIGFLAVAETTGEYLTNAILEELEKNGLDIQNCRGQGYDNGANMVGINSGVKTRILNINPRAFFTPCGCHSWNLLLVDAANSSAAAKTFFGFIQKIYLLFSRSSKRWELIKGKLKLTIKPLSDTRWESRIEAVKAILLQFDDVVECIESLKNHTEQSDTLSDCDSVLNEMLSLEFIISLHLWYEILSRVNIISKLWQSVQVHLSIALEHLRTFCDWIKEYRQTGFEQCLSDARQFIEKSSYDLPKDFKNKRVAKKKTMFDYESSDEPIQSPKSRYETDFFNTMIDSIVSNMDSRFISLNQHFENFGFLYDLSKLKNIPKEHILKNCQDLHTVLRVGESSDFQPYELYEELQTMIPNLPDFIKDVKQLLQYVTENNLKEIYPNIYIVIRILLTVPVSTASAERSFSKLKLIKNYLRSTMGQQRLSALAVLSIEADTASKLDYDTVIKEFSKAKSRKFLFL